jgi:hypothetical protein
MHRIKPTLVQWRRKFPLFGNEQKNSLLFIVDFTFSFFLRSEQYERQQQPLLDELMNRGFG